MSGVLRWEYPIELPAGNLIGKHVLEGVGRRVANSAPEAPHTNGPLVATPGGVTANRP